MSDDESIQTIMEAMEDDLQDPDKVKGFLMDGEQFTDNESVWLHNYLYQDIPEEKIYSSLDGLCRACYENVSEFVDSMKLHNQDLFDIDTEAKCFWLYQNRRNTPGFSHGDIRRCLELARCQRKA